MPIKYVDTLQKLKELNGKIITSSGLGHTELRVVARLAGVTQNISWWINTGDLSDAGNGFDDDEAAYSSSADAEGGTIEVRIRESKIQLVGGGLSRSYPALNIAPAPSAVAPSEPKGSSLFSRPTIFVAHKTGTILSSGIGRPQIFNTDTCVVAFVTRKVSIPH